MRTLLFAVIVVAGCSGSPTAPCGPVLGPEGGALTAEGVEVIVPAGALAQPTELCVSTDGDAPAAPADALEAGLLFQLTPHGLQFAQPVTVKLPFDPARVGAERELVLLHGVNGEWRELEQQSVSGAHVSGTTSSFSPFRVFPRPSLPLAIIAEPRDRTVRAGVTASFAGAATGRGLT